MKPNHFDIDEETSHLVLLKNRKIVKAIDDFLPILSEKCSAKEMKKLRRIFGELIADLYLKLDMPLLEQYPELKAQWKDMR